MVKSGKERIAAYAADRKQEGLVKFSVWIPNEPDDKASLKASAKRLRKKRGRLLPND